MTQLVYNLTQCTGNGAPRHRQFHTKRMTVPSWTLSPPWCRYAAIPNKLDTELRYTLSHGIDTSNS